MFPPIFVPYVGIKKSAEVRGIVQCLITYQFPYINELSALLALRTKYFRLSASVSLIHSDVRVTNGGPLLYRLFDSILLGTVTDLTHSMCRVILKKFETYSAARDTPYLYGIRMHNAVATKVFCSKTADIMS